MTDELKRNIHYSDLHAGWELGSIEDFIASGVLGQVNIALRDLAEDLQIHLAQEPGIFEVFGFDSQFFVDVEMDIDGGVFLMVDRAAFEKNTKVPEKWAKWFESIARQIRERVKEKT